MADITIDRIAAETIHVPIRGTSPLLMHRFDEKAKRIVLDGMQGRKTPRERKDPEADFQASLYRLKGGEGYGMPAVAFKAATIGAARFYGKTISMTALRQYLFFRGEPGDDGQLMVRIEGEPVMREDVVRVRASIDMRYRAQFTEWSAILPVTFVTSMLTRDSVVSLIDAGGMGVGVGEWRPERHGDFGTYEVDPTRNVEVVS